MQVVWQRNDETMLMRETRNDLHKKNGAAGSAKT
jgi:hypothetical protein